MHLFLYRPAMQKPTHEQLRQKYIHLAKTRGFDEAITKIHNDIGKLEPKIYDGGFEPSRLEEVEFLRALARDLFTLKLASNSEEYFKNG